MPSEIVIQDCGCISLPDEVVAALGMTPGRRLAIEVDDVAMNLTLKAIGEATGAVGVRAACPVSR
jgi:hypothetical protein